MEFDDMAWEVVTEAYEIERKLDIAVPMPEGFKLALQVLMIKELRAIKNQLSALEMLG